MDGINLLAVLAATFIVYFLGGLWYSKTLFGGIWRKESGMGEKQGGSSHSAGAFILSFIYTLVATFIFAIFIGPGPEIYYAAKTGFEIGLFFVATSFGINYLFTNRNYKLFLIDGGYHVVQFTLYGVILGLWK